jgi:hypothetical protein
MSASIKRSLNKLMLDYIKQSPPDKAVEIRRRQLAHATRRFGPDDARILASRVDYAVALHRNGESELAESELAGVIEQAGRTGAAADQDFIQLAMGWHAKILFALRRFADAEREWRAVSLMREQLHGSDHPLTLDTHVSHATALFRLDRFEEAEAEIADVVARRTALQGADSPDTLSARVAHAEFLHAAGRYGESEDAWRELTEIKTSVLGAADPGTLDVRERHAIARYKLGDFPAAAAEFADVAALRERTQGGDHADTQRTREWHKAALAELGHS